MRAEIIRYNNYSERFIFDERTHALPENAPTSMWKTWWKKRNIYSLGLRTYFRNFTIKLHLRQRRVADNASLFNKKSFQFFLTS